MAFIKLFYCHSLLSWTYDVPVSNDSNVIYQTVLFGTPLTYVVLRTALLCQHHDIVNSSC